MRKVYLIYWASGAGIARDVDIIESALRSEGYDVIAIVTRNRKSRIERLFRLLCQLPRLVWKRPLQIHIEQIHPEQFWFAWTNIVFPNPEITDRDIFRKINRAPVMACKSVEAVRIFKEENLPTFYTGFMSEDHLMKSVKKDFRQFIHIAGASNFKGTGTVLDLWKRHPEWPQLTILRTLQDCYGNPRPKIPSGDNIRVIEDWISEEALREMQNASGIHLCPSVMEGFGHYIVEALSVGSIVVTTDAPPMNELLDERCGFRVKADSQGSSFMGTRWAVQVGALESAIERINSMPEEELRLMGQNARVRYLEQAQSFKVRLVNLLNVEYEKR